MIDTNTTLYCIFGNPVRHSKSPFIHNAWFKEHQINSVYLAFEPKRIEQGINAIRQLDIQGASITIPFKTQIIPYLDKIDPDAAKIGAVNTIVNKNGKLSGYNTDSSAAVRSFKGIIELPDKTICILGAGGAAQAVAFGMVKKNGDVIIVNRNQTKAEQLAQSITGRAISYQDLEQIKSIDILINTTPVGMFPDIQDSPVPDDFLSPDMAVMDIVYNPLETQLLSRARKKGCLTIDGLSMFLHQAAEQFRIWTGITPDIESMHRTITNGDPH